MIAGDHYREDRVDETEEKRRYTSIDMVSESDAALAMTPADEAAYRKLVAETGALFGARHYLDISQLFAYAERRSWPSRRGASSSPERQPGVGERTLINPEPHLLDAGLLPP